MNPAIKNLVVTLVLMQIARKIPFERDDVTLACRVFYVTIQVTMLGIYFYISRKIESKNDTTTLKYVEPKMPGQPDPPALVSTTVRDYDLQETSKQIRQVLIGVAMMCFLHGYMKYTQPLFIQGVMPLKNIWDNQMVKIHLLNKPAVGDLKRPFKTGGGFMGAAGEPQTDAKSIKEAEARAGKKDE